MLILESFARKACFFDFFFVILHYDCNYDYIYSDYNSDGIDDSIPHQEEKMGAFDYDSVYRDGMHFSLLYANKRVGVWRHAERRTDAHKKHSGVACFSCCLCIVVLKKWRRLEDVDYGNADSFGWAELH